MINDRLGRECEELRAELGALHKKLQDLETRHAGNNAAKSGATRPIFSRKHIAVLFSIALLLATGGLLYGQGAGDALFIDPRGRVGIGTHEPRATLDVSGSLNVADTHVKGSLTTEGNAGIGTSSPTAKLEVNGRIKDQTGYVVPVGSVVAYHGATAPDGWLLCDGRVIPNEAKYQELKAVLQKSSTPDLRGRALIGAGQGGGLSLYGLGQQGGEENHKLTIDEMPAHHHYGFGEAYDPYWPFGRVGPKNQKGSRGGVDEDNFFYNTSDTGGNRPFNNMQPYYVVSYIIKY